jgi:hypothetical protein
MCGNVVLERFGLQRGGMIGNTTGDSRAWRGRNRVVMA